MNDDKFVYEVKVIDRGKTLDIALETETEDSQVTIEAKIDESNNVTVTTK